MKTISQRELRNDSGPVMREVEQGTTFRVTSRGRPVAVLSPVGAEAMDGLVSRGGTQRMEFPVGAETTESTNDVLAELRGGR